MAQEEIQKPVASNTASVPVKEIEVPVTSEKAVAAPAPEATEEKVVTEKEVAVVVPEPEVTAAKEEEEVATGKEILQSESFKEEGYLASELPEAEKNALAEFKEMVREALNKREFTAPPPPLQAPTKEEKVEEKTKEKKEEKTEEKKEELKTEDKYVEAETKTEEKYVAPATVETKKEEILVAPAPIVAETKKEETSVAPAPISCHIIRLSNFLCLFEDLCTYFFNMFLSRLFYCIQVYFIFNTF